MPHPASLLGESLGRGVVPMRTNQLRRGAAMVLLPVITALALVSVTATDARADYWSILSQVRDYMEAAPSQVADGTGALVETVGQAVETVGSAGSALVPVGQDAVATVSGGDVLTLGLAGIEAYNGTCWIQGKLVHNDSRGQACQWAPPGMNFLKFGSAGDDRTGATNTWLSSAGYSGASASFHLHVNAQESSDTLQIWYADGSGNRCDIGENSPYVGGWTAYDVTLKQGFSTAASDGASALVSAMGAAQWNHCIPGNNVSGPLHVLNARVLRYTGGGSVNDPLDPGPGYSERSRWTPDPGVGTPWSVTYTETCENASGTSTQSKTITWTPSPNAQSPDPSLPDCATVLPAGHVKALQVTGGRTGQTDVTVTAPTYSPTAETRYPLCTTKAPAGGCRVDLLKGGKSCFADGTYCAGWTANETRWNMTCEWGPYSMPLAVCEADYGQLFDGEPQANPTSTSAPSPSGGPSSTTSGSSLPTSGSNPSVGPNPATSGGTVPNVAGNTDLGGCLGAGWSWNPVSWVFVPGKCLVEWAFIPDTSQWDLSGLWNTFKTAPPGSLVVAGINLVTGLANGYQAANGCGTIAFFPGQHHDGQNTPDESLTCPSVQSIPGFSAGYALVTAGLYGSTALALFRMFGAAFKEGA